MIEAQAMNASATQHATVAEQQDRLDRALASAFPQYSRTRLQHLIGGGHAYVDGQAITDANFLVRVGQNIAVNVPAAVPADPAPEVMDLAIIFEDSDLIVIDKPSGLVVHPGAGNETGTLVNALLAHCGNSLSGIGGVKRPGIVHRIDKDTSGLLVVAKNDASHQSLSGQFASHGRDGRLQRQYLAFAWGGFERKTGTITTGIARSSTNRQKMAVSNSSTAREAITHFKVERDFLPHANISLVRCTLETGRTHQIRVHLAHISHPLLGDNVYGGGYKSAINKLEITQRDAVNALKGQALHACFLGFEHPRTGKKLRFESHLPNDLAFLLKSLE